MLERAKGRALPTRMAEILSNTGIQQRYLAMPTDYYLGVRSWAARALVYANVSGVLFEKAATQAMHRANAVAFGKRPLTPGGTSTVRSGSKRAISSTD